LENGDSTEALLELIAKAGHDFTAVDCAAAINRWACLIIEFLGCIPDVN
jgi:hypothetical protein